MSSERFTGIRLPGLQEPGIADYGRIEPSEMIRQYRAFAQHHKDMAEAVLAATDEDFRVETYVGVIVRKNLEVLQEGRTALRVKSILYEAKNAS